MSGQGPSKPRIGCRFVRGSLYLTWYWIYAKPIRPWAKPSPYPDFFSSLLFSIYYLTVKNGKNILFWLDSHLLNTRLGQPTTRVPICKLSTYLWLDLLWFSSVHFPHYHLLLLLLPPKQRTLPNFHLPLWPSQSYWTSMCQALPRVSMKIKKCVQNPIPFVLPSGPPLISLKNSEHGLSGFIPTQKIKRIQFYKKPKKNTSNILTIELNIKLPILRCRQWTHDNHSGENHTLWGKMKNNVCGTIETHRSSVTAGGGCEDPPVRVIYSRVQN